MIALVARLNERSKDIFRTIQRTDRQVIPLPPVEQNATAAFSAAIRGTVRNEESGFHGTAQELKEEGAVKKIYLGG